ncbi:FG-GAP repeat protein [Streptomyces spectabilis]|uniref:FG-GAP repeat protein n=1 Tax=Streptomyces spectabilis TaxID=68270 RepID=UPI001CEF6253|nr:FG-GAP repeat protein [Streptomyces spectabilis]
MSPSASRTRTSRPARAASRTRAAQCCSRAARTACRAAARSLSPSPPPGCPAEKSDAFGSDVLLRDTDSDKKADLLAAAPLEDGTYADSGAAWVLRGARGGPTATGVKSFGPAALGAPEKAARLGSGLGG